MTENQDPKRELPPDVIAWVNARYFGEEAGIALFALECAVDHTGAPAGDRLVRCAAVGSRGDLKRLLRLVHDLKVDFRDVIVEGEYDVIDGKLVHARFLGNSIDLDKT